MSTLPDDTTTALHPLSSVASSAVVSCPPDAGPQTKRWTRKEYHRLGELGWFQNERVELVDGEILIMSPQSFGHSWSTYVIVQLLQKLFGDEYWVRSQSPFPRDQQSEPEPDVCVTRGSFKEFTDHPTTAVLVVEVSKTSLNFDKTTKQFLYASMAVPDYWVLDLENRQLLVHRHPVADASVPFGHRYQQVETLGVDGQVSPLERPDSQLAITDMLPPQKS